MSDGLEKLKDIGAQKIHENTHIALVFVQSILHEDFNGMTKVQLFGFISILEREYSVDLSSLKAKGLEYFTKDGSSNNNSNKFFLVPTKKKNFSSFYVAVATIVFVSAIYYSITSSPSPSVDLQTQQLDNTTIENVQKYILPEIEQENNDSNDSNESNTVIIDSNLSLDEEDTVQPADEKPLKITLESVLWFGYIDMKENKKYTKNIKGELPLSSTTDWLFLAGPGEISFEIEGNTEKFSAKQNMRFKYIDKKLEKINLIEFKKLNGGLAW